MMMMHTRKMQPNFGRSAHVLNKQVEDENTTAHCVSLGKDGGLIEKVRENCTTKKGQQMQRRVLFMCTNARWRKLGDMKLDSWGKLQVLARKPAYLDFHAAKT